MDYKTFANLKKVKNSYIIVAIIVFIFGVIIYILFRNIPFLNFFQKLSFLKIQNLYIKNDSYWISMFIFNLPDGLWFFSGLLLIRAIWLMNIKWRLIYFFIFSFISLSLEIFQIFSNIPGTFDILDILIMSFFAFVESIIFIMIRGDIYEKFK